MLEDLKLLLGLEDTDKKTETAATADSECHETAVEISSCGLEPPEEMEYIILDVSVIRFNRIGSEGLSSHSVEARAFPGLKMILPDTWIDIQSYLDSQREARKGKVKFL